MDNLEPKKLALIRILQIFEKYSDCDHPLTQEDIARRLEQEYGINIERKAVSRNISLLKEAGIGIESRRAGSYLDSRRFESAELRMLIDGVLCSKYITAKHSSDLIDRLCGLSNQYFRSHVKNIYSVNEWCKTENQALFYNIEIIDDAIELGKQITFDYNKYGLDKKLHKSAFHTASPYQLLLHNQRYYLMARNERWKDVAFYRLDRITSIKLTGRPLVPLQSVKGYETGVDYRELSTGLPYMFNDKPQPVELIADGCIIDQVIDWFGTDISLRPLDGGRVMVSLRASLQAMEHWATQYINHVEVIAPKELRDKITESLQHAVKKYLGEQRHE